MKGLFKRLIYVFLFNIVFNIIFIAWFGFNVIGPSFKKVDISLTNLIKKDIPIEKIELIENEIYSLAENKGAELGKKIGGSFIGFPKYESNINNKKKEEVGYPFIPVEYYLEEQNKSVKKAINEVWD